MVIVKIGGSLLDQGPEICTPWVQRLRSLSLEDQFLVVVGGGQLVEALRKQSALWPLSEADYHHRALAMMDFNGQLFAQIYGLPSQDRAIALDDPPPIGVWTGSAQLILVSELEPSWRTTSDAVAAWLGWTLHCPVRIVKSVMPPNGIPMTLTEKSWLLWRNHFDEMTPVWVKRGVDITWIG